MPGAGFRATGSTDEAWSAGEGAEPSEVLPAAQQPELAGVVPVGFHGVGGESDLCDTLLVAGLVRGRGVPCAAGVRPQRAVGAADVVVEQQVLGVRAAGGGGLIGLARVGPLSGPLRGGATGAAACWPASAVPAARLLVASLGMGTRSLLRSGGPPLTADRVSGFRALKWYGW